MNIEAIELELELEDIDIEYEKDYVQYTKDILDNQWRKTFDIADKLSYKLGRKITVSMIRSMRLRHKKLFRGLVKARIYPNSEKTPYFWHEEALNILYNLYNPPQQKKIIEQPRTERELSTNSIRTELAIPKKININSLINLFRKQLEMIEKLLEGDDYKTNRLD